MSRFAVLVVAAGLVAAACSTPEPEAEVDIGTPGERVEAWLAALDALDLEGLRATTDPARLALIAGAENEDLTNDQLYAVIDDGLPGPTARSYWSSFRSSFENFLGADIAAIEVGAVRSFNIDDTDFAAVTIAQGDAEADLITVLGEGGWRVDLVGTAGEALASRLTTLVARLVEGAGEETVDEARRFRTAAIESLRAALTLQPDDRGLQLELDALESLPRPAA